MSNREDRERTDTVETGLSNLLGAIDDAVAEISRRLNSGEDGQVRRSVEVDTRFGQVVAEAGLHVRFVDSGASEKENLDTSETDEAAVRPVSYDLSQRGGQWALTADLPGVVRDDLSLSLNGDRLIIETSGNRRYRVDVPFPQGLALTDLDVRLEAGVLELRQTQPSEPDK
ncbi:MAG: Hsp20/alpha crystallin family protein [Pseudomonadota bacterium]